MTTHFADRLAEKIRAKESVLVMGLDPRPGWLPDELLSDPLPEASRAALADAVREFDRQLIDVAAPRIPAVKVQVAFYEALGVEGLRAFRDTVHAARDAGLLVIVDAKRSDIGSTARAYAHTFLGTDEATEDDALAGGAPPFPADALTVNPLFGTDGLEPFLDSAEQNGRGLFVLVKTSNPGAADLQDLVSGDRPVYEHIAETVERLTDDDRGTCGYAATGAVVGATQGEALERVRSHLDHHFVLTPGVGAQGGPLENLRGLADDRGLGVLVPMARSLIYAYRASSRTDWTAAVEDRVIEWNNRLNAELQG